MTVLAEPFDPLPMARRIAALAQERRAADVVLLDVRTLVDYTDFFLLVSGQSSRQNLAIAEHIVKTLKGEKRYALSKSGLDSGSWVCLDLGSVVVHVFDPETRARYDLELLWADAPRVDVESSQPAAAASAHAAAAGDEMPAASSDAPGKRRRRAVRTAAVEDADAENAPDSSRPPLDEPEPESATKPAADDDKPAGSVRRKKRGVPAKSDAAAPAPKSKKPSAKPTAPKKASGASKRAKPSPRKKPPAGAK